MDDEKIRRATVPVRFTEAEKDIVAKAAKDSYLTVSAFVRQLVLGALMKVGKEEG